MDVIRMARGWVKQRPLFIQSLSLKVDVCLLFESSYTPSLVKLRFRELILCFVRAVSVPVFCNLFILLAVFVFGGINIAQAAAPSAPTSLTATANGARAIVLSWTAPLSNGGNTITGYKIEVLSKYGRGNQNNRNRWQVLEDQTITASSQFCVFAGTTSCEHGDLEPNTKLKYRVRAINVDGESNPSNEIEGETEKLGTPATLPEFQSATANGTEIVMTFSESLRSDDNSIPRATQFGVKIGRSHQPRVRTVAIASTKVTLTLSASDAVKSTDLVFVNYIVATKSHGENDDIFVPRGNGSLKDSDNNLVEDFRFTRVENITLPRVTLMLTPASISEKGGAMSTVTATVPSPATADIIVTIAADQVEPAGRNDFTLSGTTLTIPTSQTTSTETVTITAVDNEEEDGDKKVTVSGTVDVTFVTAPADVTLTIEDDESQAADAILSRVTLALTPASISEKGEAMSMVTATVPSPATADIVVTIAAEQVEPAGRNDFTLSGTTLTIPTGQTTSTETVTITAIDNEEEDGHKKVTVSGTGDVTFATAPADVTLTIEDDESQAADAIPKAWLGRFGRTVVGQVLDGIQSRLSGAALGSHVTVEGLRLASGTGGTDARAINPNLVPRDGWLDEERAPQGFRSTIADALLPRNSFALSSCCAGADMTAWGHVAATRFDVREGEISLDGEVTTGLLGVDWSTGNWLTGLVLSLSEGDGDYGSEMDSGEVSSSLTGIHPYLSYALTERLSVWATAGYGVGDQTLKQEGGDLTESDISMKTATMGLRGELRELSEANGLRLAVLADAQSARMASDTTDADVWQLRFGVEGSRQFDYGEGKFLIPSFEIGLRRDGGDGQTGFGMDVGGRFAFSNPSSGIAAEFAARGLLSHEAEGLHEWGVSGSISFDSDPSSQHGFTFSLAPSWGTASSGGMDALMARETMAGLETNEEHDPAGLVDAVVAYGFAVTNGRFTATNYAGIRLMESSRDWRLGWQLVTAHRENLNMTLGLEATRRESSDDEPPEHGVMLRGVVRW